MGPSMPANKHLNIPPRHTYLALQLVQLRLLLFNQSPHGLKLGENLSFAVRQRRCSRGGLRKRGRSRCINEAGLKKAYCNRKERFGHGNPRT